MTVALRLGHLPGDEPARPLEGVDADHASEKRGGYLLAPAALLPFRERGGDPERAEHAGEDVRYGDADLRGRAAQRSGKAHQAALALRDLVEPRTMAVRPALAEARNREVHQPGV